MRLKLYVLTTNDGRQKSIVKAMVDGVVFVMITKREGRYILKIAFYIPFMKLLEEGNVIEGCVSLRKM